jgi:acetyl esterase/lipase
MTAETPLGMAKMYAGGQDLRNPYISPLYGDLSGLPPVLVQVGTAELMFEDATGLVDGIERAGGTATLETYEGMIHVFQQVAPEVPESVAAISAIGTFLNKYMS